jgi:hypothetical protein
MTYDTFESLQVGSRVKLTGKVRTYPIVRIGRNFHRRVAYACLNPIAVERRGEAPLEFGIFAASSLDHKSHYINWDKIS